MTTKVRETLQFSEEFVSKTAIPGGWKSSNNALRAASSFSSKGCTWAVSKNNLKWNYKMIWIWSCVDWYFNQSLFLSKIFLMFVIAVIPDWSILKEDSLVSFFIWHFSSHSNLINVEVDISYTYKIKKNLRRFRLKSLYEIKRSNCCDIFCFTYRLNHFKKKVFYDLQNTFLNQHQTLWTN